MTGGIIHPTRANTGSGVHKGGWPRQMDGYNYEYSPKCEQRGRKAMVPTLWKMVRKELQQPLDGYPRRVARKGAS